jgi:peptidoglycan/xylan/chitin deacetylase (PgdA/CDA1 family)
MSCAVATLATGAGFSAFYYIPYGRRMPSMDTVFLTFDDGPDPACTPTILDILSEHRSQATFFMLGEAVERYPYLVRQIVAAGHTPAIHGYTHEPGVFWTPEAAGEALDRSVSAVLTTGAAGPVQYYRPTYGLRGPGMSLAVRRRALRMVLWTLDSHDYLLRSPVRIRGRLGEHLQAGDIVLMHDAGETGAASARALPGILADISARGWMARALPHA